MHVGIDQSGDHPLPSRVDHLRIVWHTQFVTRSDIANAPTLDDDRCVADGGAAGARDHCRALNDGESAWLLSTEQRDFPIQKNRSDKQTEDSATNLRRTHVCLPREGFESLFVP